MKREGRTINSIRNIGAGLINRVVLLIFPFVIRTMIIYVLGEEYLGLSSLFTSILNLLNLSELGFGSALVYSMYRPIEENNIGQVCALLNFYKKVYHIIGCVVLGIGILLVPFLSQLIKGSYPQQINLYVLYIIYLLNTALGYFVFAYKKALIIAYQRNDIVSHVNSAVNIAMYVLQLIILLVTRNYYAYVLMLPIFTIIENVWTSIIASKQWKNIQCIGEISKQETLEIRDHVKGIALQKICSTSRNTFDSIVISMYLGLKAIVIYNNYFYIMSSIHSLMYLIPNAIRASVGNSLVSSDMKKNYNDFKIFSFIYNWISIWFSVALFCLYQPFMIIWMGNDRLVPMITVSFFCLYFYELNTGDIVALYKDAAGLWWQGRYRTIIEAIANLILNFALGKIGGMNGILLATIITSLFGGICYGGYIVYRYCFKDEALSDFINSLIMNVIVLVVTAGITYMCCQFIVINNIYMKLLFCFGICVVVPNIVMWMAYGQLDIFKKAQQFLLKVIKKKI